MSVGLDVQCNVTARVTRGADICGGGSSGGGAHQGGARGNPRVAASVRLDTREDAVAEVPTATAG